MHITKVLDRFLVQVAADGRSEHTRLQYARHTRLFALWLEQEGRSTDIATIDHEDLALFLTSSAARTRADGRRKKASSTNALRSSLRVFFRYCHEAGLVETNPSRLTRRAITSPPPPRALSRDEEQRFVNALDQARGSEERRDAVLFRLMLASGVRISSALGLDVEDVDLDEGTLLLRRVKGDRVERVFLGTEIRRLLSEYVGERRSGPLFAGPAGRRISARHAQRRFRAWRERAGVSKSATSHSLRHSFAMRLYAQTNDVLLVQAALHHRSVASTLVYAKPDEHALRRALGAQLFRAGSRENEPGLGVPFQGP